MMAAHAFKAPEFAINEIQAKAMAEAIEGVSGEYVSSVDPKAIAWGNFAIVMLGVYGTSYAKYSERKKNEKNGQRQNVVSLTGT